VIPSRSRCLRHRKTMASCQDCTAALRARIAAERGTANPPATPTEDRAFALAA
jgi:hypothetical protein